MDELKNLKMQNQSLMEIVEVAKQITSDLDIKHIFKNINYVMRAKFQPFFCSFVIPADIDDPSPMEYIYEGPVRRKSKLNFSSITPLLDYFKEQEFNQVSFEHFLTVYHDKQVLVELSSRESEFIVPLKTDKGINGIFLQGRKANGLPYSLEDIQFCVNVISFASIALDNANLYRKATTDRMTKLFNHHQFQKTLEEEIIKYRQNDGKFSLIIFDIDHFKKFNDNYGHLQGDIIIKSIASLLMQSVRDIDYPARYGGEEFAVILPDVGLDEAYEVAERIRKKIADFEFPGENQVFHATISLGVAEYDSINVKVNEDIIGAADKALYVSKESGRNRVTKGGY